MAPKMRMRFRKTFPIFGKWLKWTVSKKGVSLNLRMGYLSKSWNSNGQNSTTVDAPGTFGLFWRKQENRKKKSVGVTEDEARFLNEQNSRAFWSKASYFLIAVEALVELFRIYVYGFGMEAKGSAVIVLAILVVAQLALVQLLKSVGLKGFGILFFTLVGIFIQWKLFGALAMNEVHESAKEVVKNTTPEVTTPKPKKSPADD